LKRNGERSQPLPDETIQLMGRKIEKPNPEKNAWEHNSLIIQSSACSLEARYSPLSHFGALLLGIMGNIRLTVWG
jgi:tRNA uridine 5-carbamoylmethylation protein Kti12